WEVASRLLGPSSTEDRVAGGPSLFSPGAHPPLGAGYARIFAASAVSTISISYWPGSSRSEVALGGTSMKIQELGHAVIKVRNRQRAEEFYGEVLGMPIVARRDEPPLTFFSLGN